MHTLIIRIAATEEVENPTQDRPGGLTREAYVVVRDKLSSVDTVVATIEGDSVETVMTAEVGATAVEAMVVRGELIKTRNF